MGAQRRPGSLEAWTVHRVVTLEISPEAARRAQDIAARTDRRLEDVLADWIDRAVAEPPVETLPDEQVLALSRSELPPAQQDELSDLLASQREAGLSSAEGERLDELLDAYRRGLVRKAQSLRAAVARGLLPPLA